MADDSNGDPEELLQQSKEQTRHTSEPSSRTSSDEVTPDRTEAITEALLAIDDGDIPENINIRDARLKALLVGLEDAGELDNVSRELTAVLASDVDIDQATQSDVARLLIRVGLQEAAPQVLDDAKDAHQAALMEQANDF